MASLNQHSVVIQRVRTAAGIRFRARLLGKRSGQQQVTQTYTFSRTEGALTREEAISDLEDRLGYGTRPDVIHA